VVQQRLPYGSGTPTTKISNEFSAAEEDLRSAKAAMHGIAKEIRAWGR